MSSAEWRGSLAIDVPVPRDLDETGRHALDQRLHPLLGLLLIIDLGPGIADAQPIHLAIMMAHTMIVLNAITEEQLGAFSALLPPWCDAAARRLPAELREQPERLVEHVALLRKRHVRRILVRIPMQPDLVARVADQRALLREGLQGVPWDEPGGFDVVLFEELEQARHTDSAREHACGLLDEKEEGSLGIVPREMSFVESSPP